MRMKMQQELNVKRKIRSDLPDSREEAKAVSGKRRKKRRARRYAIYYILIIVIVISAMATLSMTVFFNIRNITVSDLTLYSSEEIIAAAEIEEGENLIRLNKEKAAQKILDKLTYIDQVSVNVKLPDTLQIECTEAEITYNYEINGSYAYISQSGRILELGKSESYSGVLTVVGLSIENPKVGMFINDSSSGQFERLDTLRQLIEQNEFAAADINSIDISSETLSEIVYQNRITIEIKTQDDAEYVMRAAKDVIDQSIGKAEKGKIFYVSSTQQIHFVPED